MSSHTFEEEEMQYFYDFICASATHYNEVLRIGF